MISRILLIDDDQELLTNLKGGVEAALNGENVEVVVWRPAENDDAKAVFFDLTPANTRLVVTDYNLTGNGKTGLFGSSIVDWSQLKLIPVGDFSRGNAAELPSAPNTFEIRVPTTDQAANFVASVYRGFSEIRTKLTQDQTLLDLGSPSAILSAIIGAEEDESQIALYGLRLSSISGALTARLVANNENAIGSVEEKVSLVTYIAGHLLLNAVLRFPGPLISSKALCAYCGVSFGESEGLMELFADARYLGPFHEIGPYFWTRKVDLILDPIIGQLEKDVEFETNGELNRAAIEHKVGRAFGKHDCPRCNGKNGGFICPFTSKIDCARDDCSVGSNSWIPQGANICRIERTFYDEWSPILGF